MGWAACHWLLRSVGERIVVPRHAARSPAGARHNFAMEFLGEREDLARLLGTLDAPTLRQVLLDLAEDHQAVCDRLHRLRVASDPADLTAQFSRQLDWWASDHRYVRLEAASAFSHELTVWLSQVEREVMPQFPLKALALLQAFIELDKLLFERVDDSGADVGAAFRQACDLWINAAASAGLAAVDIASRAAALLANNNYGARGHLASAITR